MTSKCFPWSRWGSWLVGPVLMLGCSGQVRTDAAPGRYDRAADTATSPATNPTPKPAAVAAPEPAEPVTRTPVSPTTVQPAASRPPAATAQPAQAGLPPAQLPTTTGTTAVFPPGTPDATLRAAFACVQQNDFACYAALNVRSNRDGDISLAHLRGYQWRAFRERWVSYVVRKDPFSLHITRRVQEPGKEPRVKLFVFSQDRDNPAPCIFALEDGVWRIYANSL